MSDAYCKSLFQQYLRSFVGNMALSNVRLPAALLSERYKQGFYDCIAETLRFLALSEGLIINETSKARLLVHLKDYFSRITYGTVKIRI